jgi:hypothetical protein
VVAIAVAVESVAAVVAAVTVSKVDRSI